MLSGQGGVAGTIYRFGSIFEVGMASQGYHLGYQGTALLVVLGHWVVIFRSWASKTDRATAEHVF